MTQSTRQPFNGSRVLQQWNAERAAQRRGPVFVSVKNFDAAKNDHLTYGWKATNASADTDLRGALDTMRARSRTLAQNNDYMRKFLRMVEINVVGPEGFRFKSLARDFQNGRETADEAARDVIERHFAAWSKPRGGCDITGRHSFAALLKLAAKACARDGEFLIRRVFGPASRNPYGYAMQLLDIDRLDVQRNGEHNGNAVVMGVEIDKLGMPVAYHLLSEHPGALGYTMPRGQKYERIPAEQIFHGFLADRPEQHRGAPWAHTAMLRLEMLGKFQTAALVAARKGAETVGVLTRSIDADITNPALGEVDAATGQAYETSLPGTWETLPAGYSMSAYESKYPDQVFGQFVKDSLRGVAAGLGVAYNGLANDLEGVNFSSIRAGVLEERDCWIELQKWMTEQLVTPAFQDWLSMGLLAGAITFPNGKPLPVAKSDKFADHAFLGRRWSWVDPEKDARANILAIQNGFKTRDQVAGEQGSDWHDNIQMLAEEEAWAKQYGVTLGDPSKVPLVPAADPPADGAPPAEPAP